MEETTNGTPPSDHKRKRTALENEEQERHEEDELHNGGSERHSVPFKLTPIFGRAELDDTVKQICDFIYKNAAIPDVEIEAKIGVLTTKGTHERIFLPISCETCVMHDPESWFAFHSELPLKVFQMLNNKLNERVMASQKGGSRGPSQVTYTHYVERNIFYHNGVRVSMTEDGKEQKIIQKKRVGDLNVYCPNKHFDFRISISTETELNEKPQGRPLFERRKERLSYRHEMFSIDLTTVDTIRDGAANKITYELEVEIIDMPLLLRERERLRNNAPNNFSHIVQGLRDQVRSLLGVVGSRGLSPVVYNHY